MDAQAGEVGGLNGPVLAEPSKGTSATGTPARIPAAASTGRPTYRSSVRYAGRGEVPLTSLGEQQAKAADLQIAGIDKTNASAGWS